MTTPLYALAIVGIGAAAVFSYSKIGEHQEELDKTTELKETAVRLGSAIAKAQRQYDGKPAKTAEVKAELDEIKADLEDQELEKTALDDKVKQLTAKSVAQAAQLEDAEEIINKFKEAFEGQNIPVTGIADYVNQLTDEKEGLEADFEEVLAVTETTQAKLDDGKKVLNDYKKREVERSRNLSQNSISSLITAVNADWGFVVIKPHPGAVITTDSQLVVVRGGKSLGRLKINAVEPNRVVADIDFDSLVAGSRVRAGDRVILAQTQSR